RSPRPLARGRRVEEHQAERTRVDADHGDPRVADGRRTRRVEDPQVEPGAERREDADRRARRGLYRRCGGRGSRRWGGGPGLGRGRSARATGEAEGEGPGEEEAT